jgi:hypothetical protein
MSLIDRDKEYPCHCGNYLLINDIYRDSQNLLGTGSSDYYAVICYINNNIKDYKWMYDEIIDKILYGTIDSDSFLTGTKSSYFH